MAISETPKSIYFSTDFKPIRDGLRLSDLMEKKSPQVVNDAISFICKMSLSQRIELMTAYHDTQSTVCFHLCQSFLDDLFSVTKNKKIHRLISLLVMPQDIAYLSLLNEAIKSKKSLESVLLIFMKEREKMPTVAAEYFGTFHTHLVGDLKKSLSSEQATLCINYVENRKTVDSIFENGIESYVKLFLTNVKNKKSDDIVSLFSLYSKEDFVKFIKAFHEATDLDLMDFIKDRLKLPITDSLFCIYELTNNISKGVAFYFSRYLSKELDFSPNLMVVLSESIFPEVVHFYWEITSSSMLEECTKKYKEDELHFIEEIFRPLKIAESN